MRFDRLPASSALSPSRAIIGRWLGARLPVTAIWIAIELKLAKPHRENVTMAIVAGDNTPCSLPSSIEGDEFVDHHLGAEQSARDPRLAVRPVL